MTGQNYLDFLQNELPKQLEDVPLATRIAMYFQHDGPILWPPRILTFPPGTSFISNVEVNDVS